MLTTETIAFTEDKRESLEKQKRVIGKVFQEAEKEGLSIQEVKNMLVRMDIRIKSAEVKANMQMPFKKELTD